MVQVFLKFIKTLHISYGKPAKQKELHLAIFWSLVRFSRRSWTILSQINFRIVTTAKSRIAWKDKAIEYVYWRFKVYKQQQSFFFYFFLLFFIYCFSLCSLTTTKVEMNWSQRERERGRGKEIDSNGNGCSNNNKDDAHDLKQYWDSP